MKPPAPPPNSRPDRPRCGARRGSAFRIAVVSGFAMALAGCSLFADPKPAPELDPAARTERIQALRAAIERDHVRLTTLITEPREEASPELHQDPEIERIAHRLNRHERELDALERAERTTLR